MKKSIIDVISIKTALFLNVPVIWLNTGNEYSLLFAFFNIFLKSINLTVIWQNPLFSLTIFYIKN